MTIIRSAGAVTISSAFCWEDGLAKDAYYQHLNVAQVPVTLHRRNLKTQLYFYG